MNLFQDDDLPVLMYPGSFWSYVARHSCWGIEDQWYSGLRQELRRWRMMGVVAQTRNLVGFSCSFTIFHQSIWVNGKEVSQPQRTKIDAVMKVSQKWSS